MFRHLRSDDKNFFHALHNFIKATRACFLIQLWSWIKNKLAVNQSAPIFGHHYLYALYVKG